MGHSSIQATVDAYGHLVPSANIAWVDQLDSKTIPQESASLAQAAEEDVPAHFPQLIGGDWWRRVDSNHGPRDYETLALAT